MKNKKFSFSKGITITSLVLFCVILIKCLSVEYTTYMDTTVAATAVTISGTLATTCVVWNLKKAQSENLIKIRMGMYGDVKQIELEYNEKMFELKSKYRISEEEFYEIKDMSSIDDFSNEVLQEMDSEMIERSNDANSDTEAQG